MSTIKNTSCLHGKICKRCKKKNSNNDKECHYCGCPLKPFKILCPKCNTHNNLTNTECQNDKCDNVFYKPKPVQNKKRYMTMSDIIPDDPFK